MSRMTSGRLEELRRIAEAATPGPWRISDDGPADRFVIASADREHIAETTQGGSFTDEDLANAHHISTFDPSTVLALLNEIERLRREREVLADALQHVYTCDHCECALCPQGAELAYKAYRAVSKASELLAGEEGVDGVTHFALYHPDLNVWECQACRFQWEFMEDGNPYEHGMRFCPRCGRRIVRGTQHLAGV